jgi:hypothetical protein
MANVHPPLPEDITIRMTGPNAEVLAKAMERFTKHMGESVKWTTPIRHGDKHGDCLVYGKYLPHRDQD